MVLDSWQHQAQPERILYPAFLLVENTLVVHSAEICDFLLQLCNVNYWISYAAAGFVFVYRCAVSALVFFGM